MPSYTPVLRILHLTDTHLFGDGSKHYGVVDTTDHLRRALSHVESENFDLVVCAGDVSEDGSGASYEIARDLIVPWAEARGARAIFAMGNHDSRGAFRAVLGDGQPGAETVRMRTGNDADKAPVVSVAASNGWRTIVLDTSVPGAGYGELGAEQLEFLRAALAETPAEEAAAHGTILIMHHPPVDAQTELLQALALDQGDASALWRVLRGSDVRVILSGHYHLPIVEIVDGVPVVVAPGVANIASGFESRFEESASDSFGGAVIEVSGERLRVLPFEQPVTQAEVFRLGPDTVQSIIGVAGRPSI